jgi:hypothetical protein
MSREVWWVERSDNSRRWLVCREDRRRGLTDTIALDTKPEALAVVKALNARLLCSQCGKRFAAAACGPTHAAIAVGGR